MPEDNEVDYRKVYGVVWDEDFPLTPLEAWYIMRGYAVQPRSGIDVETFLKLPGSLELLDGYVTLRQR